MSEQQNSMVPGYLTVELNGAAGDPDEKQLVAHPDPDDPRHIESVGRVYALRGPERAERHARFIEASWNGVQNAAHRLGLDPLTLAERLEDGGLDTILCALLAAQDELPKPSSAPMKSRPRAIQAADAVEEAIGLINPEA